MKPFDIWVSFIVSLITNMIVLSGTIAFLFWLEELPNSWAKRVKPLIEIVLSTLYFVYLWGQSWLSSGIAANAFGFHWTFLNMIIVSMFLINVYLDIWLEVFIEAVLMLSYVLFFAPTFNIYTVIYYLAFTFMLVFCYHWGDLLLKDAALMYLSLGVMGFTAIALVSCLFGVSTDPYFWLRQITALILLSIVGIEYTLSSKRLLERNTQAAKMANRDGLTLLDNFSKFDKDLAKAHERFRIDRKPYAIFELDIDLFKQVNDNYGHLVGNTVLKAIAQELAQFAASLPYPANAYRIGGEEFCLIIHDDFSDDDVAFKVADQIRRRISQLSFTIGTSTINVTASVGQANSRLDHYNAHDVYKMADRSLYLSKQRGRNRVTLEGNTIVGMN